MVEGVHAADPDGLILPDGPLTEQDAEAYVASTCFKTGPPGQVGVELEWHLLDLRTRHGPVDPNRLTTVLEHHLSDQDPLPAGGLLTREPGGQLELSSRPARSLTHCLTEVQTDVSRLRALLAAHGLGLLGTGMDPLRPPRRVLDAPRYVAMERFFDRFGPEGRTMMCSTAAVQVCLDAGVDGSSAAGFRRRWELAHLLGPVLVASFANSPLACGRPTGWRSARQRVWARLDPRRTRPAWTSLGLSAHRNGGGQGTGSDPRLVWSRYALDAEVLCVRGHDGRWDVPSGLSFREWLRSGALRPPTWDDLAYHLTTLFPPVRPRGWVELRMIDAQPGDGWVVPAAVTAALIEDPVAADVATDVIERLWAGEHAEGWVVDGRPRAGTRAPLWERAARDALADPVIAAAARSCFVAALEALPRLGVPVSVRAAAEAYHARYVERARTPADDLLAAWTRGEDVTLEELVPC